MSRALSPEEVAVLIQARQIQKEKGLAKDLDVSEVCRAAGVSRKTGYQWADKHGSAGRRQELDDVSDRLQQLEAEHAELKQHHARVCFENEGRKLAWEIHHVDEYLESKKKHFADQDKTKAVEFLRTVSEPLSTVSWLLCVSLGLLFRWDREFDEKLRGQAKSDARGKEAKVTIDIARLVVETAQEILERGDRLYVKCLTEHLDVEKKVTLSCKTVQEILIANDLWQTRTRQSRPRFYKSLCQRIPNGLLSLDGGDFKVVLGDKSLKYNVELGVDVGSFCHTSSTVTSTEASACVLKVLEEHCREWGNPLGVVFDHGSANMSEQVDQYLQERGIEIVPAGPGNPKGNGSLESAIGQMKEAIGPIRIDTSSEYALGKSVLETLTSLYIKMRNKLSLRHPRPTPFEQMTASVSDYERQLERDRLAAHKQSKDKTNTDMEKVDRVHWLIKYHELNPESAALKRAEQTIQGYETQAIIKSEEAFLKTVNRNPNRRNLSYFFGILKNIQQDMDEQRYQDYCRKKYSYGFLLKMEREKMEAQSQSKPGIAEVVALAKNTLTLTIKSIRESARRICRIKLGQLLSTKKYLGPLRKQIQEMIGAQKDLDLEQKEKLANHIDELINQTVEA